VSSGTGLLFSYAIGAIFAIGGVLFLLLLDEHRFLFGIPYLAIGVLLIGGVRGSQRRRKAHEAGEGNTGGAPRSPSH
jgi:hypothetical protein